MSTTLSRNKRPRVVGRRRHLLIAGASSVLTSISALSASTTTTLSTTKSCAELGLFETSVLGQPGVYCVDKLPCSGSPEVNGLTSSHFTCPKMGQVDQSGMYLLDQPSCCASIEIGTIGCVPQSFLRSNLNMKCLGPIAPPASLGMEMGTTNPVISTSSSSGNTLASIAPIVTPRPSSSRPPIIKPTTTPIPTPSRRPSASSSSSFSTSADGSMSSLFEVAADVGEDKVAREEKRSNDLLERVGFIPKEREKKTESKPIVHDNINELPIEPIEEIQEKEEEPYIRSNGSKQDQNSSNRVDTNSRKEGVLSGNTIVFIAVGVALTIAIIGGAWLFRRKTSHTYNNTMTTTTSRHSDPLIQEEGAL